MRTAIVSNLPKENSLRSRRILIILCLSPHNVSSIYLDGLRVASVALIQILTNGGFLFNRCFKSDVVSLLKFQTVTIYDFFEKCFLSIRFVVIHNKSLRQIEQNLSRPITNFTKFQKNDDADISAAELQQAKTRTV